MAIVFYVFSSVYIIIITVIVTLTMAHRGRVVGISSAVNVTHVLRDLRTTLSDGAVQANVMPL